MIELMTKGLMKILLQGFVQVISQVDISNK